VKHERREDIFIPLPPEGELKFQMQVMMKMMEIMNFMMGNMCDKVEKVEKCDNKAGTVTQDMRMVGAEPKSKNGSRVERPRWANYENFEEEVDDFGDGGFKDEIVGHIFDSLET